MNLVNDVVPFENIRSEPRPYVISAADTTTWDGDERQDTLQVYPEHHHARLPERATNRSAGYDLFALNEEIIAGNSRLLVNTGIRVVLPLGTYGKIESRSGLAARHGITVAAGVIDPDYTGQLKVLLVNNTNVEVRLPKDQAIAQLILIKYHEAADVENVGSLKKYYVLHEKRFPDNNRGDYGFGSTTAPLPV